MVGQKNATTAAREIRISTSALQNINEITGYIAFIQHQPLNALKIGDAIFSTIDRIARNPFAFKECEELPTKLKIYRRAVCHSWLVIYKITHSEIVILGIVHGKRTPSKIKKLSKVK